MNFLLAACVSATTSVSNVTPSSTSESIITATNNVSSLINDIVQTISISDFDIPNYYLKEFLVANGNPDAIWVFTNSVNPTGIDKIGFLVSLYYKKQQMIVTYGRGQATIGEEWLTGCIMYSPSLRIWAWNESLGIPENAFSNLDVIRMSWKSISEATQGVLDIDKFYQSFSNPNAEPCFQTPKNIWSEP